MKKYLSCILFVCIAVLMLNACSNDTGVSPGASSEQEGLSGKISTSGSTSMEKVVASLIEAFTKKNPSLKMSFDATGSGAGITAALEGVADIGLSSRNLKEGEEAAKATVVALDGIAVIVNNENQVRNLTVEQLGKIFSGKITNWNEVGGKDELIQIVGREAGSGTREGFESILDVMDVCVYDQEHTSTGAVITAIAANSNAIGYASIASVSSKISTLSVGGVECTEATILDGTYQIQRPFLMVTAADKEIDDKVKAFMEFALSKEAEDIIRKAGAVQVKGK
ncbi:phosphate ABC transporter substrate-binding protein [Clostridia bacterium]|nr:phosphate ABC transporter substrate-binding protein [Clostridia bacterium]